MVKTMVKKINMTTNKSICFILPGYSYKALGGYKITIISLRFRHGGEKTTNLC